VIVEEKRREGAEIRRLEQGKNMKVPGQCPLVLLEREGRQKLRRSEMEKLV
jgi:hypothetical protein